MTREQIAKILSLIKRAYPQYSNETEKDFALLVELWYVQFRNESYANVYTATMHWISTNHFPPSIAGIKSTIYEISSDDKPLPPERAWELVHKAGKNSRYNAHEEYKNLPEWLKPSVTEDLLRAIADSSNENLVFIKKDFLKSYEESLESRKRDVQISSISNDIKMLGAKKADLFLDEGNNSHDG